jgi:hypothetical protein
VTDSQKSRLTFDQVAALLVPIVEREDHHDGDGNVRTEYAHPKLNAMLTAFLGLSGVPRYEDFSNLESAAHGVLDPRVFDASVERMEGIAGLLREFSESIYAQITAAKLRQSELREQKKAMADSMRKSRAVKAKQQYDGEPF